LPRGRHVLELLACWRVMEACRVSHDLGELSSGHIGAWSERAIGIAVDDAKAHQAVDELVEG